MTDGRQYSLELIHYQTKDCAADFSLDALNETVWASQAQIASLFGLATNTVTEHIKKIFRDGELEEAAVTRKFRVSGKDGKDYSTLHYNLDMILSVGYRVSSKRATEFRKWATVTLKQYITQGFALDESRLRNDPSALKDLAAKVRELRANEKNIYGAVRDVFAFGSSDYEANSNAAKGFFSRLQDKFCYAITGQQSAEIVLDRADHNLRNMGLNTIGGTMPQKSEATVAKNYLNEDELYGLHILCEQFLLFVESKALRGKKLTMQEMAEKFDELLAVQGHPVFREYKGYLAGRAKNHALAELHLYRERVRALPAA